MKPYHVDYCTHAARGRVFDFLKNNNRGALVALAIPVALLDGVSPFVQTTAAAIEALSCGLFNTVASAFSKDYTEDRNSSWKQLGKNLGYLLPSLVEGAYRLGNDLVYLPLKPDDYIKLRLDGQKNSTAHLYKVLGHNQYKCHYSDLLNGGIGMVIPVKKNNDGVQFADDCIDYQDNQKRDNDDTSGEDDHLIAIEEKKAQAMIELTDLKQ